MHLLPTPEEVVRVLRDTGALRHGHFASPNGVHSDEYLDIPLAMRYYQHARMLSVGLSRMVRSNPELRACISDLSIVAAGPAGLPVAYGMCEALRAKQVYWAEKQEGRPMRFPQFLEQHPHEQVVMVDDILRSGSKLTEMKELLEKMARKCRCGRDHLSTDAADQEFRQPAALLFGEVERQLLRRQLQLRDVPARRTVGNGLDLSMTKQFVRYSTGRGSAYGELVGDRIFELAGGLFEARTRTEAEFQLSDVRLLPPCEPTKIIGVGLNYRSHLGGRKLPETPELFYKPPSALVATGESIVIPRDATDVHFEGELVIIIGKRVKSASPEEAAAAIFGVTCGNDVSDRGWQRGEQKDLQWWRAKVAIPSRQWDRRS